MVYIKKKKNLILFNPGISLSSLIIFLLFSLFLLSFSFALCSLQTQGFLRCPSLSNKLDASLSDDPLSPIVIPTRHRCFDPFTNSLISDPFVWEWVFKGLWVWIKILFAKSQTKLRQSLKSNQNQNQSNLLGGF